MFVAHDLELTLYVGIPEKTQTPDQTNKQTKKQTNKQTNKQQTKKMYY